MDEKIKKAKIELREEKSPFFTEDEIKYYIFEKHNGNFDRAMHEMCLMKAENDYISLSGGFEMADNSSYWKMLANKYKAKKNSFLLK